MKLRTRTISTKEIFYLISFFFLMQPRWFYYIRSLNILFKLVDIALFGYYLLTYYTNNKRSRVVDLVILYHVYLVLVTIFQGGEIDTAVMDSCMFIGLSILTDRAMRTRPHFLFSKLMYLLDAEVIFNLLTMFLFPNGLYRTDYFSHNYFLGYDNQMINVIIPTVLLAFMYVETKARGSFLHLIVMSVVVLTSIVKAWSGASLVIVAIVYLLLLFKFKDNTNVFNMRNYFIVNVVLFFVLVVFRLQELFDYLIVVVLQKDLTMTGRVYTWSRAIDFILKNPIFGYGIEEQSYRASKMALRQYFAVSARSAIFPGLHANNRFLETAYRGGIILLVIYIAMLLIVVKKLMKNKKLSSAKILAVVLFAYLTGMLTEFYRLSYMFFPMMVMAENIELIEESIKSYSKAYSAPGLRFKLKRLRI